ncbi:alpha/beta hydrolase [Variovorax sp. J31P216]|nr:alpha/beta hydrolase [Variovorax sp. J31P216]
MRALKILSVAALVLGCQSTPTPIARTWELPAGVKAVQVNGYEMAYVEQGSGVPVIFVHGAAVDYRYFSAQMEPFSGKYRTIAVSLRRYYPEPWRGDGEFSLNQHVDDLMEFIKQLNAGPVHLVGHSRGGTVALYAASKNPGMVRTLTFAEGGAGMAAFSPEDPALVQRRAVAMPAITERLKAGQTDAGLEIFIDYVSGPGAWKALPEAIKSSLRANAWTLTAGEKDTASWPPLSCGEVKRLAMPVLLLEGERTPGTFKAILDSVQVCLPRATREVVKNSSHGTPRANPQGFNAAVMAFIAAH